MKYECALIAGSEYDFLAVEVSFENGTLAVVSQETGEGNYDVTVFPPTEYEARMVGSKKYLDKHAVSVTALSRAISDAITRLESKEPSKFASWLPKD